MPEMAKEATAFAYNRPGDGKSDKPFTPRDGKTIAEELRQLLREQGLQPPYVLVGHSLGVAPQRYGTQGVAMTRASASPSKSKTRPALASAGPQ